MVFLFILVALLYCIVWSCAVLCHVKNVCTYEYACIMLLCVEWGGSRWVLGKRGSGFGQTPV